MKYLILVVIAIISTDYSFAQSDAVVINSIFDELFPEIVHTSFKTKEDTIFINSNRNSTSFDYDSVSFVNETGFMVPNRIITEFHKNVETKSIVACWDQKELNRKDIIYLPNDTIVGIRPFVKCLSTDEKKSFYENKSQRRCVYFIDRIIFDDGQENAVFSFGYTSWLPDSYFRQMIFIKKIFGKWVILSRFHNLIS